MDFGRAFTYAFQDPDWLKKVGLAAVIFLIPVIGPIVVMGWGLEITRRVIQQESELLPAWDQFSEYLPKGFQAFVVSLAYSLPAILIVICGQLANVGVIAGASESNSDTMATVAIVVMSCTYCLFAILLFIAGLMIPAANGLLATNGNLGAAFRFNEVLSLVRAAPGQYILMNLAVGAANLLLAPLGSIICLVGVYLTAAYSLTLSAHLTGQAYNAARAAQQASGQASL